MTAQPAEVDYDALVVAAATRLAARLRRAGFVPDEIVRLMRDQGFDVLVGDVVDLLVSAGARRRYRGDADLERAA